MEPVWCGLAALYFLGNLAFLGMLKDEDIPAWQVLCILLFGWFIPIGALVVLMMGSAVYGIAMGIKVLLRAFCRCGGNTEGGDAK